MKKSYVEADIELLLLANEDIITESAGDIVDTENDGEWD